MAAFTIYFLVIGLIAPAIGGLVDRHGPKRVMAIGAVVMGSGFIVLSLMNDLWHFYGGYVLIGMGQTGVGMISVTAVISNWFKRRRGTAIGIMSTGIGAGGLVLAPVIGGYLIPNLGWSWSYRILAVLVWLLIPLVLAVIRTRPADLGLYPDGVAQPEPETANGISRSSSGGLTLKQAVATSAFWLIAVSYFTNGFSQVGLIQTQVPYLEDIGFPVGAAAGALGVVGLGSLIGKFSFGWLCDRMPAKYVWCISLGFQLVGTIVLMLMNPSSPLALVWLYAIVMGFGVGGWLPTMSMMVSGVFGLASYGVIYGMITLAQSAGSATGPLMAGYMYDATGTYRWIFIIFLALYAVAIPAILAMRRPGPK
jgi:MFS family permease